MSARALLFAQFLVLLVLSLIHIFGNLNYLYWQYRWLDIPAHFLGGVWVGFLVMWIGALRGTMPTLIFCVSAGVSLGIAWEFFELGIGALKFQTEAFDTIGDLFMDAVGAAAASLFAVYVPRVSKKQ